MIEVIIGESGSGKTTYIKNELIKYKIKDIAFLPQEISGVFNPLRNVYSQLFEIKFDENKFDDLLKKLKLNHLSLNRYPYEFSTGELQRFALLSILLKDNVKKIFLDEPTSNLDLSNQLSLVEILKNLKTPMLISTHNLDFANKLSQNIRVIKKGKLFNLDKNYKKITDFEDILNKKSIKIDNSDKFTFLNESKNVLIFGKSGYGKTTFLYKINDFLIKSNVKTSFLSQDYSFSLSPQRTILKTLLEVINFRDNKFFNSKLDVIEIIKIFRKLKLPAKLLKRYPSELSQGEKQRILIIRAILLKTSFVLLDEPTSNLDLENEKKLLDCLFILQKEYNCKFIIVSHSNYIISSLLQKKATYALYFKKQFVYDVYKTIT